MGGQLVGPFLGALLGLLTGLAIQWWKSRRDERRLLVDEFCRLVRQAGDISAECWLATASDDPVQLTKRRLLEARVLGLQEEVLGMHVLIALPA